MANLKQNIVVVDDDTEMNLALERLLNAAGFRVATFPSAEALLESGAAGGASCLVLDVHLPGLTGFQLRQRLAEAGTMPPVIFITAFDDPASRKGAKEAGAIAYFTKPFPGRGFIAAIDQALAEGGDPCH